MLKNIKKFKKNTNDEKTIHYLEQTKGIKFLSQTWIFRSLYIFATWWCKHLIGSNRIHRFKYYLKSTTLPAKILENQSMWQRLNSFMFKIMNLFDYLWNEMVYQPMQANVKVNEECNTTAQWCKGEISIFYLTKFVGAQEPHLTYYHYSSNFVKWNCFFPKHLKNCASKLLI